MKNILLNAHWCPAKHNSIKNYKYCIKSGHYEVIGDFSKEVNALSKMNLCPVGMVIRGLMETKCKEQVLVSREYAETHVYFNRAVTRLNNLKAHHKHFAEWSNKHIYPWQYECIRMIWGQNNREILWICDQLGNCGKSFLSNFLSICYGFVQLDGSINSRDLAVMLLEKFHGIVVNGCRARGNQIDYESIEQLKLNSSVLENLWVSTEESPRIIFANEYPNYRASSHDR